MPGHQCKFFFFTDGACGSACLYFLIGTLRQYLSRVACTRPCAVPLLPYGALTHVCTCARRLDVVPIQRKRLQGCRAPEARCWPCWPWGFWLHSSVTHWDQIALSESRTTASWWMALTRSWCRVGATRCFIFRAEHHISDV